MPKSGRAAELSILCLAFFLARISSFTCAKCGSNAIKSLPPQRMSSAFCGCHNFVYAIISQKIGTIIELIAFNLS